MEDGMNDLRARWVRTVAILMMGRTRIEQPLVSDNPAKFANYLNRFYARYDNIDYRDECDR